MAPRTEAYRENNTDILCFLRGFMEYGCERRVKSFPALGSLLWGELLFSLRQKTPFSYPFYEWDGNLPVGNALDNVMFGLHFLCVERRGDLRISLASEIGRLEDDRFFSKSDSFDEAVASAFAEAEKIEGFLEY